MQWVLAVSLSFMQIYPFLNPRVNLTRLLIPDESYFQFTLYLCSFDIISETERDRANRLNVYPLRVLVCKHMNIYMSHDPQDDKNSKM